MVQRRDVRYVTNRQRNTSSVGNMLQHLKWHSLEDRRRDARLVMMYKISHCKMAVSKSDRLSPPLRHSRNMHSRSYQVPLCSLVGHNRERHNFSLVPLYTGTAYLRLQCWVTQSNPSGLPLSHLIPKFNPFCLYIFLNLFSYYYFFSFFAMQFPWHNL